MTKAVETCPAVAVLDPSGPGASDSDPGDARIANGDIGCGGSSRPVEIIRYVSYLLKMKRLEASAAVSLSVLDYILPSCSLSFGHFR